ncbi:TspO/MBR family protein [Microcoleus sp. FACHB-672]|uniref:TspO/MBR family protein n=1 Tax=Microcoleus sp. FACHB-672 TaxID=2692825 RepID=UPI001687693F|nr:tryptophan-rich sensory protein [Microcoleus sp. FACHB-672]MBD2039685.1 tryptophan-rich sensory protein [Microcoleus sp. FACHB-672]
MIESWMVIGGVTFIVALGTVLMRPRDTMWGVHLRRPEWLVFEPAIPFIWTAIFAAGAASATIVWDKDPGSLKTWLLMGLYLLLEIVTVAYIPMTLRLRSLKIGTILGGSGVILGVVLALIVWPISGWAAGLLLPYLLWSPVGTYTTWEMIQLNPEAA